MDIRHNGATTGRAGVLLIAILLPPHGHANADDESGGWKGAKVLPKLGAEVKMGDTTIDYYKGGFPFPWTVQDVDGEWLLVGERKNGWVRRNQVVTIDEAPDYYTQFTKRSPHEAWAYAMRAISLGLNGDLNSAIADFGEVIRLKPTAQAYFERGEAWRMKKAWDNAIADYDQAIRLDPSDAMAYANRGAAWKEKGDLGKATADYDQAIRVDQNDAQALNNAAWLKATSSDDRFRDGKKAVEFATRACELTGWSNRYTVGTLAAAYAEAGDFDSAIKYQNRAIELKPTDADVLKAENGRLALYKDHKPYREK